MVRLIFGFPIYQRLISELLNNSSLILGDFVINRFPNKELYMRLGTDVENKECLVFATIAPPDENLIGCLLLAHTLKKEGAKSVELIVPYLSYTRQDKNKEKESLATDLVGKMFQIAGVDKILTVDVHSEHVAKLFPIPIRSLSSDALFTEVIKKENLLDAVLVAPDKGALKKAESIAKALGMRSPAFFEKQRTKEGVKHLGFKGSLGKKGVIIDDMLDTGETLVLCAEALVKAGVSEIYVIITHGIFAGERWLKLFDLNVKKIFCTDTFPQTKALPNQEKMKQSLFSSKMSKLFSPKIEVVGVAPLVAKYLEIEHEKPRT